ncbi:RNA polymerase sigma factor [Parabacteroides sp. Marseille-P3160]|uniref:RNA polymerase sigma factor n=1 Tax=Parabacteroides sp. Marseille-P3160 TaxID=1917887 RepID=UPI0009B9869B|nr:sigma-70 family RNA polymerase sigma factor [Parabacteroides sp. Marseille-P3160]
MEAETAELIKECRKGKRVAQLNLYSRYAGWIYATCLRIVGNSMEAEEAMQDSFLKALTRLEQYHEGQSFDAWLKQIAVHTSIDYVRRKVPDWEELKETADIPSEEDADAAEITCTVERIKREIANLPPGYRLILSLSLFEGYDTDEIASILKIKPVTVRSQYLRAKRKLLERIGDK